MPSLAAMPPPSPPASVTDPGNRRNHSDTGVTFLVGTGGDEVKDRGDDNEEEEDGGEEAGGGDAGGSGGKMDPAPPGDD